MVKLGLRQVNIPAEVIPTQIILQSINLDYQ